MPAIDPDKLEDHVRAFDRRIRRRNIVEFAACALVAAIFVAKAFDWLPEAGTATLAGTIIRIGDGLVALAAVLVAVQLHRLARPVSGRMKSAGLLSFHLDQLQRQSAALKASPVWYVAPFLPGIVLIFGGHAARAGTALFWPLAGAAVAVAVLAGIVWVNLNAAKAFDAEMRWLEEMERQSLS